jgi:hypothetical protein
LTPIKRPGSSSADDDDRAHAGARNDGMDESRRDDADAGPATPAEMAAAAEAYRWRGWSVIPVAPQGKRPLVPWREFQQRAATAAEVRAWFSRWPHANVGIVTGALSRLAVIDVDAPHGGLQSLAQLERDRGPLPGTPQVLSGGGGRHFYFRHPGAWIANRVALRPGIDLRADGGCVVAPPSLHPSGRRYRWLSGSGPESVPPAPLPACFLEHDRSSAHTVHPPEHWRRLVREGVDEGARNATLASLTGHLLQRGVDPGVALELMLAWNRAQCRPPLPDYEVVQVVQSIARLHQH